MVNSRRKGAAGEREFAAYLRDRGHEARRGQQFSGSPDSPDVICNLPAHFEVKRVEKLNIREAMEQALGECGNRIAIVAHRTNRTEWLATLRMDDLLCLLSRRESIAPAAAILPLSAENRKPIAGTASTAKAA